MFLKPKRITASFVSSDIRRQNNTKCSCESLNDVFALLTASDYMLCKTNLSLTPRARQQPGLSTQLP